jgi:hypothetical protein
MRVRELRILTRDIPNPGYDRRRRYGAAAIQTFPSGMVFEYYPPVAEILPNGKAFVEPPVVYMKNVSGAIRNISDIFEASKPYSPATFSDIVFSRGCSSASTWALDVLEAMLRDGIVTNEQCVKYLDDVEKQLEENQ